MSFPSALGLSRAQTVPSSPLPYRFLRALQEECHICPETNYASNHTRCIVSSFTVTAKTSIGCMRVIFNASRLVVFYETLPLSIIKLLPFVCVFVCSLSLLFYFKQAPIHGITGILESATMKRVWGDYPALKAEGTQKRSARLILA